MKLHRYVKVKHERGFDYTLTIKKWGIPLLFHKVLKERFVLKWYHWILFYPYLCLKVMFGGANV